MYTSYNCVFPCGGGGRRLNYVGTKEIIGLHADNGGPATGVREKTM